jgi:large subunit ribosomal protein L1
VAQQGDGIDLSFSTSVDRTRPECPLLAPARPPAGTCASRTVGGSPFGSDTLAKSKHSKRFRALAEKVKTTDPVPLAEAVKQLKQFGTTKFNQTVEVSTNLGIDPRQSDQNVRGSVALPHGIGKAVRVAVFAKGENAEKATAAGADIVGADELANQVKAGQMDFDVALATPDMMGLVGPLGRVLGPRGLMPSPRSGTVTTDIAGAVREFKAGKIEFRNDKGGNVAAPVGKLTFSEEQLLENIQAFLGHLKSVKPAAAKGAYIRTVTISATMSPGIRVLA